MNRYKALTTLILPALLATFASTPTQTTYAQTPTFTDISDSYASTEIQALAAQGVIGGYGDGTFHPTSTMTRDEFASILAHAMQLKTDTAASARFTDVEPWARPYVGALVNAGITSGTSTTTYGARDPISREQLAVFFLRAMQSASQAQTLNLHGTFDDRDIISEYARPFVGLTQRIGFIQGATDTQGLLKFDPQGNAERQAVARLSYEFVLHQAAYQNKIASFTNTAALLDSTVQVMENLQSANIAYTRIRFGNDQERATIQWTKNPFTVHMLGTHQGVDASNQPTSETIESYAANGYLYQPRSANGQVTWSKRAYTQSTLGPYESVVPHGMLKASMTHDLAPFLTAQEDATTYTLTGSLTGRDYQILFLLPEDWSHPAPGPMTYRLVIDKATKHLTAMRIEQTDPSHFLSDYAFQDFNNVPPVTVPQEILDNA
ncbi:S-layer homology domain-containing protein [Tumebacillus sp. ITR2]|uniref:S-layer homology domain-containing protein n=1 Tax=Tumebacillus amylolyticus TaxID=2801339 RepID=A0ABS1J9I5_9BACL|nr:S-layer homology domain-containing protein [Tumebacillus amylolyticus]MBL0386933.1 S-layer homology domain-containing protein [Tumebacillus amylolyticus]